MPRGESHAKTKRRKGKTAATATKVSAITSARRSSGRAATTVKDTSFSPRTGAGASLRRGLSRREVAELAGVSLGAVDKAIEQKVLRPKRVKSRETVLDPESVAVVRVLYAAGIPLPARIKRGVRDWIYREKPHRSNRAEELRVSETLSIRCGPEVADVAERSEDYLSKRNEYIESNPLVMGGEPVIKGTRITVYGIARRLELGEKMDVLLEDYPYVPREAVETAALYAKTHPRRGRPVPPWRKAKSSV